MSDQPTAIEWIPNIHEANAALVAEREKVWILQKVAKETEIEIQQLREQLAAEREKPYPRFKCLICKKGANDLSPPHYLERVSATGKDAPALWLCTEHLNYDMRQKWIELCDKSSDNETKASARAELAQIALAAVTDIPSYASGTSIPSDTIVIPSVSEYDDWAAQVERHSERDWSEHLRIQLAAEVEKVNKLQQQLSAEREQWQLATEECHRIIHRKNEELSAERAKWQRAETDYHNQVAQNKQLREELTAERQHVAALQKLEGTLSEELVNERENVEELREQVKDYLEKCPAPATGEWTPKMFRQLLSHAANRGMIDEYVQDACNLINADLAAVEEKYENATDNLYRDIKRLNQQLAAEHGRAENWKHNAERYEVELAAEQDLNVLLMQERDKLQDQLATEQEGK